MSKPGTEREPECLRDLRAQLALMQEAVELLTDRVAVLETVTAPEYGWEEYLAALGVDPQANTKGLNHVETHDGSDADGVTRRPTGPGHPAGVGDSPGDSVGNDAAPDDETCPHQRRWDDDGGEWCLDCYLAGVGDPPGDADGDDAAPLNAPCEHERLAQRFPGPDLYGQECLDCGELVPPQESSRTGVGDALLSRPSDYVHKWTNYEAADHTKCSGAIRWDGIRREWFCSACQRRAVPTPGGDTTCLHEDSEQHQSGFGGHRTCRTCRAYSVVESVTWGPWQPPPATGSEE